MSSYPMPTILDVKHVPGVRQQLAELPRELSTPLSVQLEGFRGRDLQPGEHVELLSVDGRSVRLNFFVDTDGTLWIERIGTT